MIYNKSGAVAVYTMASLAKGAPQKRGKGAPRKPVTGGTPVSGNMKSHDLREACRTEQHLKFLLPEANRVDEKRKRIVSELNNIRQRRKWLEKEDTEGMLELIALDQRLKKQQNEVETERKALQSKVLFENAMFWTCAPRRPAQATAEANAKAKAEADAKAEAEANAKAEAEANAKAKDEAAKNLERELTANRRDQLAAEQAEIEIPVREAAWEADKLRMQQIAAEEVTREVFCGCLGLEDSRCNGNGVV